MICTGDGRAAGSGGGPRGPDWRTHIRGGAAKRRACVPFQPHLAAARGGRPSQALLRRGPLAAAGVHFLQGRRAARQGGQDVQHLGALHAARPRWPPPPHLPSGVSPCPRLAPRPALMLSEVQLASLQQDFQNGIIDVKLEY